MGRSADRVIGVGRLLRQHRRRAGLTLEELANRAGLSARTLGNVERGVSRGPQRHTIEAVADALDLSAAERSLLELALRAARASVAEPVPREGAPRAVEHFVGRDQERAAIHRAAATAVPEGPTPVVVVSGAPGVGKTALGVRSASELVARFPDGVRFVDLRGYGTHPLGATDALAAVLAVLGIPNSSIPPGLDERVSLYRDTIRAQRVVLVLDDLVDQHLLDRLKATGASMLIVTRRRPQEPGEPAGKLTAIALEPLSVAESVAVLAAFLKVPVEPGPDQLLPQLARLCGNNPLALELVARRLLSRPRWSPAFMIDRLTDAGTRLSELSAGDASMRATFEVSYRQLSDPARQVFCAMSLLDGASATAALIAQAAGVQGDVAHRALRELSEVGLVAVRSSDRFTMHDLLKVYSGDELRASANATVIEAARQRTTVWLLRHAVAAALAFDPDAVAEGSDEFATTDGAQDWLRAELDNWYPAYRRAADYSEHGMVLEVAEAMHWYSEETTSWTGWSEVFRLSGRSAVALADRRLEATHLGYLSWAQATAEGDAATALMTARQAAVAAEAADASDQLGWAYFYQACANFALGRVADAISSATAAARVFETVEERNALPQALGVLGVGLRSAGRLEDALAAHRRALDLVMSPVTRPRGRTGDQTEAALLSNIGTDLERLGHDAQAVLYYARAYLLADSLLWAPAQVGMRLRCATPLTALNRLDESLVMLNEALVLQERLDDEAEEDRIRVQIADLERALGEARRT